MASRFAVGAQRAFLTGCATLDDNMAASQEGESGSRQAASRGEQGNNFEFCEVALITGTSKANAIADFYNSTGTDICTPEKFAALDEEKIKKETGSREVFLNPSRRWMFDRARCL